MATEQKIVRRKKNKKQNTIYKVFGIIADIIIYPVVVISLLAALGMLITNRNNALPTIFGTSFVKILSGSMKEDGFLVGDVVFIKQTNIEDLKVGDVVAFYKYFDSADKPYYPHLVKIEDYNGENYGAIIENRVSSEGFKTKRPAFFHKIKDIYVLPYDGTIFFQTGGAGEGEVDGYIRSDYIIGKYSETPRFVRDTLKFCSSQLGMISMIVVPLSILVLLECLSIVEQVNDIILENKVFSREVPYDNKDSLKANIGEEMEIYRQVYFYATALPEERQKIKMFLWGNLYEKEITKKELALKKLVDESLQLSNIDDYFDYWQKNITNSFQKRKFKKLVEEYNLKNSYEKTREEVGEK